MKKHNITKSEYEAIKALAKKNQNKRTDKRLQVLILRYEGLTDAAIGEKLGYHRKRVSQLCAEYKTVGLEEYTQRRYGGNNRNMSAEEERAFLSQFEESAERGQIITVAEIAAAYDEKTGKRHISNSTIYYVLHKAGWRQITPRTVHPGKASEAEIKASKKLTPRSKK